VPRKDASRTAGPTAGDDRPQPSPDIASGVANVIDAALGVGVTLARVTAEATALGRTVEPVPPDTPAISAIVRYGLTAASNLVSAVVSGARELTPSVRPGKSPAAGASVPAAAGRPAGPRTTPGATLRVPLSVENPSDRAMRDLRPRLRALRRDSADALHLIGAECVRFKPEDFEVAPHDFEKLTVTVSVPASAPAGDYEVIFALGDAEPDLRMAFAVTVG
jgi:hypothetical protein